MPDACEDWRRFDAGMIPSKASTPLWKLRRSRRPRGVSDTINAGYARLDAAGSHLAGEHHGCLSRIEQGEVLCVTHHFTADEPVKQLETAGCAFPRLACARLGQARTGDLQQEC